MQTVNYRQVQQYCKSCKVGQKLDCFDCK